MNDGALGDEIVRAPRGAWRAAREARGGVRRRARGVRAHPPRDHPPPAPRAQARIFGDEDMHTLLIAHVLDNSVVAVVAVAGEGAAADRVVALPVARAAARPNPGRRRRTACRAAPAACRRPRGRCQDGRVPRAGGGARDQRVTRAVGRIGHRCVVCATPASSIWSSSSVHDTGCDEPTRSSSLYVRSRWPTAYARALLLALHEFESTDFILHICGSSSLDFFFARSRWRAAARLAWAPPHQARERGPDPHAVSQPHNLVWRCTPVQLGRFSKGPPTIRLAWAGMI